MFAGDDFWGEMDLARSTAVSYQPKKREKNRVDCDRVCNLTRLCDCVRPLSSGQSAALQQPKSIAPSQRPRLTLASGLSLALGGQVLLELAGADLVLFDLLAAEAGDLLEELGDLVGHAEAVVGLGVFASGGGCSGVC